MTMALSYDLSEDAATILQNIEVAQHAITYVRLPFKSQFSFGPYRCRARILGNAERFAIALTIFAGRVPYTAEDRDGRKALLKSRGIAMANAGALEIMSDNWAIVKTRFAVLQPPTRQTVCVALGAKLGQLRPALDAVAGHTIA
ncbi:MAG: hypothetical protein AAF337_02200 [Pseudomonadota bacterium]